MGSLRCFVLLFPSAIFPPNVLPIRPCSCANFQQEHDCTVCLRARSCNVLSEAFTGYLSTIVSCPSPIGTLPPYKYKQELQKCLVGAATRKPVVLPSRSQKDPQNWNRPTYHHDRYPPIGLDNFRKDHHMRSYPGATTADRQRQAMSRSLKNENIVVRLIPS